MNWNILGLVASLTPGAGLNPDTYYCSDPSINSVMCNPGSGGSSASIPVVAPAGLNTAPPVIPQINNLNTAPPIVPQVNTDPLQLPGLPAPLNPGANLPVSNPGQIMSLPATVPVQPTTTTPAQVVKSNPWLIGLMVAGGIYLYSKKKK